MSGTLPATRVGWERGLVALYLPSLFFHWAQAAEPCPRPPSHVEQRQCLERAAAKSAADVISAQEVAWLRIHGSDEASESKDRSLKLLAEAEDEFAKYRSSQCLYEWSLASAGSSADDLRLACEIRLNRAFSNALKQ